MHEHHHKAGGPLKMHLGGAAAWSLNEREDVSMVYERQNDYNGHPLSVHNHYCFEEWIIFYKQSRYGLWGLRLLLMLGKSEEEGCVFYGLEVFMWNSFSFHVKYVSVQLTSPGQSQTSPCATVMVGWSKWRVRVFVAFWEAWCLAVFGRHRGGCQTGSRS